ncbi:MAG: DNA phosphorothioation system sulfurtransferase DndC [Chthoniobacteraceae bacterium]
MKPAPAPTPATARKSAFSEFGLPRTVALLAEEIRELYCADDVPWIVGYSGGKDSTATLQLIWLAVAKLPVERRTKTVHVISTDTLVENPIVASWVQKSLEIMGKKALAAAMPIKPHLLHPRVEESFWVNLIGKGYPAPRPKFRWCTERLKIKPSNRFISKIVTDNGEAILCIGARKAESTARARVLTKNQKHRVRDRLSPSATLPGCSIYTPIEDWSNDDVWMFLMQVPNAWGYSNKDLLGMYAGASADGECPLVVDTSTPSCGDSRFGCWVCTLVEKDKSMTAMIHNDEEKEWMMPLLALRNELDFRNTDENGAQSSDHHLRDFRRMTGAIHVMQDGKPVPGPYTQTSRERWLRKLLEAQTWIRSHGPADVRKIELVKLDELQEIRRIWVVDKHEMEDSLPRIYTEVTGEPYPGRRLDDNLVLGAEEMTELQSLCGGDQMHYELTRELLSVERQQRAHSKRSELFERLEKSMGRHFYDDKEDAMTTARRRSAERGQARDGQRDGVEAASSPAEPKAIF